MIHPRPHLVRHAWLSLDGTWAFAFDPGDEGEREGWHRGHGEWPLLIEVPFPWESPRSGVGGPAPDRYVRGAGEIQGGIGWYRRRVDLPQGWAGDRIWIVVGAAYWHARVWVDGTLAVEHDGGYGPFEVDVTELIRAPGAFGLVIRVDAPTDTDEYPHGKNTRHWYSRASGIWQTVFVEARPPTHVDSMQIRTDLASGAVEIELGIRAPAATTASLRVDVLKEGRVEASLVQSARIARGVQSQRVRMDVPSPAPWSLDSPSLYGVRVVLKGVEGRGDVVESTFGFRSITFEALPGDGPKWLHLNGAPLYVRAVMSQGYHPEGILAYPDEATIENDLRSAKRAGFNMVRLHVKVEDPRVLAWADRLGILLWCEVPDFLTPTEAARDRWERTWRAMLERDAGHPSIAIWCMFIESWGLGINQFGFGHAERRFADDHAMQAWVEEMRALGRTIDPTRPIIENSVSESDHTVAEVNDIHVFPTGYGDLGTAAVSVLEPWLVGAYPGSNDNFAPGYVQGDQPLMVSSMAGWSSVDGVETSWPFRQLVNEVRARERIAGYGWVQLYDVEWELTGMGSYDRGPKAFGYDPAEINADDVLVVRGLMARQVDPGATVAVDVALAHASGRVAGPVDITAWLEGFGSRWRPSRTTPTSAPSGGHVDRYGLVPLGRAEATAPLGAFAGRLIIEARDARRQVVARTYVPVATLAPAGGWPLEGLLELPLDRWRAEPSAGWDGLLVRGERQRISSPRLAIDFDLEEGPAPDMENAILLVGEAALLDGSHRGQTMIEQPAGGVRVLLDGFVVAVVTAPFLCADSAGILSIVNPEGIGTYGGPLRVELGRRDGITGGRHTIILEPADPGPQRGVVLFGPLLGRAPLGPGLHLAGPGRGHAGGSRASGSGIEPWSSR